MAKKKPYVRKKKAVKKKRILKKKIKLKQIAKKRKKREAKAESKISTVMREFKEGDLPIGKSKKKVKNRKQALAIALAESRRVTGKKRRKK